MFDIDAAGIKVVGIFRSEESAKKVLARLGNPAEDKFVAIVGNIGKQIPHNGIHWIEFMHQKCN